MTDTMINRFIKSKNHPDFWGLTEKNTIRDMVSLIGAYQNLNNHECTEENFEEYFEQNNGRRSLYNRGRAKLKQLLFQKIESEVFNDRLTKSKELWYSNSVINKLCSTSWGHCVFLPKNANEIFSVLFDYIHNDDGNIILKNTFYNKIARNCYLYNGNIEAENMYVNCINWILGFQNMFMYEIQNNRIYTTKNKEIAGTIQGAISTTIQKEKIYRRCPIVNQ